MNANIINGDAYEVLKSMDPESVDCIITSPPYWQKRDYGTDGQIGLEPTWELYLSKLLLVFGECKRVLKPHGSMWIVICDSYAGWKNGITDPGGKFSLPLNAMCSRKCAMPRCWSVSLSEPVET